MAKVIRLMGVRVALASSRAERIDLSIDIETGGILPFDFRCDDSVELDLEGHLLLPGLINAHDHLEFSLFPRLGRGPYANASAWAADIYHPGKSPVKEHLLIPKPVRLLWGGIRNLLSGVTTVAHHNPHEASLFTGRFPVRVLRRYGWAHSLDFSPDIGEIRKSTPARWPFIVHAAEGTDDRAHGEIPRLKELGVLDPRTVLVHSVAIGKRETETITQSGASIVWCPTSNLFMLGRTLTAEIVRSPIPIALGTDSALTGDGDLLDEMKCARKAAALTAEEMYPLVTASAAWMLGLRNGQGVIRERGVADLVAVADVGHTPAQALAGLLPELVMVRGRVMLLSDRLVGRRTFPRFKGLNRIQVEGRGIFWIRADVQRLHAAASTAIGTEVQLAGKRICP
jgi:cytosine/adenosine deaminase-related metal-dependent hydrolase